MKSCNDLVNACVSTKTHIILYLTMKNHIQYLYHKYIKLFILICLISLGCCSTSEAQITTPTGKLIGNAVMDSFLQKQMDS